jgi:hypothetical protein
MSRIAEVYQEQQEQDTRENLSGLENTAYLAGNWHEYTRRLLAEHELIGRKVQYERKQLQNLKEQHHG